jgi:hypothetical protein
MKIAQETQGQLVLKQSGLSARIFGILFVVIGIGVFTLFSSQNITAARLIGGVFALVGIFVFITAKYITITIDKTQNKCNFFTVTLIGKKSQDVALDQIKEVSLEETITHSTGSDGPENQINYTLVFYLQDGEGIPVPISSASGSFSVNGLPMGEMVGRNKNVVLGNNIATFIGVPFVDRRPPSFTEAIGEVVQKINATPGK